MNILSIPEFNNYIKIAGIALAYGPFLNESGLIPTILCTTSAAMTGGYAIEVTAGIFLKVIQKGLAFSRNGEPNPDLSAMASRYITHGMNGIRANIVTSLWLQLLAYDANLRANAKTLS